MDNEIARINAELAGLSREADFPMTLLPLSTFRVADELGAIRDLPEADAIVHFAAGDGGSDLMAPVNAVDRLGKDVVFFVRHQSGPLYYWYEGASARYLRQHTDEQAKQKVLCEDVVVDRMDEVLWRLRALAGLKNTRGATILAVGGPSSWGWPLEKTIQQIRDAWKLDIRTVPYDALGRLVEEARKDGDAVARARQRAREYLALPHTSLETGRDFVENAFLLEQVFRGLMAKAGCRMVTVSECMTTIMPMARTTACLTLSLLNDAGFQAFCESDFVVIPSGILLGAIAGRPVFLNDPTYPHDGLITLAHCTAPRRMDGKRLEPARLRTHFESDYGAAPQVQMQVGQQVTMVAPDFASKRWLGLSGVIADHADLPMCRSQIDVRLEAPCPEVARRMPGFHWMLAYGDYRREMGYALRRVGIQWDYLG